MAGIEAVPVSLGERVRFEDLLRPLIQPAYRIAFTQLQDRQLAEDAVQEACVNAWRRFGQLRDQAGLRAWFFRIVINESRTLRRSRWWSVLKLTELPLPQWRSPADEAAAGLDLKAAVARLDPEQRMLLYLYFSLDLPFEEIGPIVGLSAKAAKARLYRITRKLRPDLQLMEVIN